MKHLFFLLAASSVLLFSCGSNNNATPRVRTLSDSLLKEVLDGHDVGMAKMRKLTQLQQQTQLVMDSIKKLPANIQKTTAPYLAKLDSLKADLQYAEYAMNRWMEEFNVDSANNDTDKRIQYLKDEREKVSKVKEAILSSLEKADSLLKK